MLAIGLCWSLELSAALPRGEGAVPEPCNAWEDPGTASGIFGINRKRCVFAQCSVLLWSNKPEKNPVEVLNAQKLILA